MNTYWLNILRKRAKNILVVEDEISMISLYRMLLNKCRCDFKIVKDYNEAVKTLIHKKIDICIIDIMLQGKAGDALIPIIEILYPDCKIYIYTAKSDYENENYKVFYKGNGIKEILKTIQKDLI